MELTVSRILDGGPDDRMGISLWSNPFTLAFICGMCLEYVRVNRLIFISLIKFKQMPSKEDLIKIDKLREELNKKGIKSLSWYWTLGRFDGVLIYEAPTAKDAMKFAVESAKLGLASTETLLAIPREEAIKLL